MRFTDSLLFFVLLLLTTNALHLQKSTSLKASLSSKQGNWQCYQWNSADTNAGAGLGNVSLEQQLCESKNGGTTQYKFTHGDGTCGNCWCCKRENICLPVTAYTAILPQVPSWQCYSWTSADANAGAGHGDAALEQQLCNGKTDFATAHEFKFTQGDSTCQNSSGGNCWCCHRANQPLLNPFQTGDVVTIRSAQFNNVFLRGTTYCSSSAICNCGIANGQFGAGAWEKWKLTRQDDGSFCITNNNFNTSVLTLDGSNCSSMTGHGCGTVGFDYNDTGSCRGKSAFRLINQGNGKYAIRSDLYPNAYLRLDGNGLTTSHGDGGGSVNAQYYSQGPIGGYEAFIIEKAN